MKKKQRNNYLKFTSIAIQMGVTIYVGSLLGNWLDIKYPNPNELYTKICTLIAVFGAMASIIIQVIKITNKNE